MKEQIISFETAKLAKEKGFNWECSYTWSEADKGVESAFDLTGEMYFSNEEIENALANGFTVYMAPTQSLLQKWLREEHDIHITIYRRKSPDATFFQAEVNNIGVGCFTGESDDETYEGILEAALVEGLKKIGV
jgi:hypothetical protein